MEAHAVTSLSFYCVHKGTELVSFHDHWPHVKTAVLTLRPRAVCVITCTLSVGSSWFKHAQAQGVAKNGFSYTKTVLGATRVGQS